MRTSLLFGLTLLLLSIQTNSQQGWFEQNSGTTNDLLSVYFIDSLCGWIGTSEGRILKTINGGEDWNLYSTNSNKDVFSIYFINRDTGWCASSTYSSGGEGDIYKTENGGITWIQKFNGPTILKSVFFNNKNIGWTVGTGFHPVGPQRIKTTDGGETWQADSIPGNIVRPEEVYFPNENLGFIVGGQSGRIIRTTDGGESWSETIIGGWFKDVSFSDELHGICVGGVPAKTNDGGETWEVFYTGLQFEIHVAVANYYPKNWIVDHYIVISTTDDGGKWFPQYYNYYGFAGIQMRDISFVNDSIGWIVGDEGLILKTINGGNPIVGEPQIPILLHPVNNSIAYTPVYFVWEKIEYSAYELQVSQDSLFINPIISIRRVDTVYSAYLNTSSEYYWRVRSENINSYSEWSPPVYFSTATSDIEESKILYEFRLSQNYPNPFNPTTTIKYQIPEISFVTIKVYDVLGNETATLINEEKPAGEYNVEFRIDNLELTSGIYFYKLQAGNFTITKKMVILK